jgi:DNA-binding transcriptional MerR regulator
LTLDGQGLTIAIVATTVLRMRDLVRRTGVSAPTIHFYAQQGLLPAARKTAGNQALYPDATVTRIRWIRDLQTELNLSLRSIAQVLTMRGEIAVEEIRALQALGALLEEPDPAAGTADLAAVRERLAPTDIASLQRLGLVSSTGPISNSDLRLLDLVAAMRGCGFTEEAGFSIESLALYRDAVERLVADELARIVEPVLHRHDAQTLRDLVHSGLPLTDRLLSLLHQRAVRGEMQRWLDIAPDAAGATA